jgi:hypothetical protein
MELLFDGAAAGDRFHRKTSALQPEAFVAADPAMWMPVLVDPGVLLSALMAPLTSIGTVVPPMTAGTQRHPVGGVTSILVRNVCPLDATIGGATGLASGGRALLAAHPIVKRRVTDVIAPPVALAGTADLP